MPIRLGQYEFSAPEPLLVWNPLALRGVLALLLRDSPCTPQSFHVVAFFETGDMSQHRMTYAKRVYSGSQVMAQGIHRFWVAEYPMLQSSTDDRQAVVDELSRHYGCLHEINRLTIQEVPAVISVE